MATPPAFTTLGELEFRASALVPEDLWAFIQGGGGDERTLRANVEAFARLRLRPRVLVDVAELDIGTHLLGQRVAAPLYVAPTAYQGMLHPEGELATARAAAAAGTLAMFGTLSSRSLEEIAGAAPTARRWFQLYPQPEFDSTRRLIERAEISGYSAIVLTVDVPVFGRRDRQFRVGFAKDSLPSLGNGPGLVAPAREPEAAELGTGRYAVRGGLPMEWKVLDQIRRATKLPLVVKGILTGEDARIAVEHGAKAVIVSNHGGRQLDGAPASLEALPEVVRAVGRRTEVYLDGGVRRGPDVVAALALGARAVGVGRPVLWALSVGGETGVARYLELLKLDLVATMALLGRRTIEELDRGVLNNPPGEPTLTGARSSRRAGSDRARRPAARKGPPKPRERRTR